MAKTPAKSPSNTSQNNPVNSASIKVAKVARTETVHPDYHFIRVVMTDGAEYKTRSTWGKEGDTLNLDIDPLTHPAWTGGEQKMLDRGGRVSRFTSRFGTLGAKR